VTTVNREDQPSEGRVVEAIVRGRTYSYIIEPLQKPVFVEEKCLLAADLEVVMSRNIRRKSHPQASPCFSVLLVRFDLRAFKARLSEEEAKRPPRSRPNMLGNWERPV
jgi:hypothetical protein